MNNEQYKLLGEFCQQIKVWIKLGFPSFGYVFMKNYGICHNFSVWLKTHKDITAHERALLCALLFEEMGSVYPFNTEKTYSDECGYRTIFDNVKRLEWIGKRADGLEYATTLLDRIKIEYLKLKFKLGWVL